MVDTARDQRSTILPVLVRNRTRLAAAQAALLVYVVAVLVVSRMLPPER